MDTVGDTVHQTVQEFRGASMIDESRLDEETQRLLVSAQQIKQNFYWQHLVRQLDAESFAAMSECTRYLEEGEITKAQFAAAKVRAYNWLLEMVEQPIESAKVLADQPEVI